MARITQISQIYDCKLRELRDPQKWEDTLKRASNFWKVSLCESMLITEQNPNATICGTLKQWNNVGRYVRRGEKSIAVFKDRTDTRLEYIFDITQTYGAAINVKWIMSENIADGIVGKYNAENPSEKADSLEDFLQKSLDKSLDLIYNDINVNNAIAADPRAAALIAESAKCICFTRCGIEHTYNFTDSARLNSDISIIELGNAASALARDVLSDVDQIIRRKEYEHYEAAVCGRPLRYPLRGEGQRVEIPDIRELRQGADAADGEKSGEFDERNRSDGTRLYQHERTVPDDLGRNREESGTTPIDDREVTERKNDTERGLQSEDSTADSDRNRISSRGLGNSASVRGVASPRSTEQRNVGGNRKDSFEYDDELIEDDEDNEAEFDEDSASPVYDGDQLTLFDDEPKYADGLFIGEYNRFALLENEIMNGTPFEGGKFRILEYCNTAAPSHKELAAFLKKEYGIGGHSGYGDVDFVDYDSKGIRIRIKDKSVPDGISTAYFGWNDIAGYVEELINAGEYVTQEDIDKRAAKEALKNAERKTVTAYRIGDFYEFYGDDAILTALEINLTQTKRGSVPMTGVPVHALEDYKSRLAALGINVEVGDSRDIEKILNPETADTYITENASAEKAKAALLDYAESHIAYYDSDICQAFLNGNREDFDSAVKTAVDEAISDVTGEKISELNGADFSELYREMYEDGEFANAVYAEISDRLYAKHREIDKGRQAAHEAGLPYDEYPYDPEENYDPYAYDPNRMSDDDYDRMLDLIDAERAEAEKLIGETVTIDDRDYSVTDIISNGSDGFIAKLHYENDGTQSDIYEDLYVVQDMLKQQDRQSIKDSIELKIPYTEDGLLHRFLDEHYPDKNPPFALANAMFKYLDEKFSTEDVGYNKTDFEITAYGILDNGEEDFKYDGRFDIGDGDGHGGGKSLVEHIYDFNKYVEENKPWFYSDEGIVRAKQTLEVLVPYLERGSKLSAEEQEILDKFKTQYPIMRAEESKTVKLKSVVDESVITEEIPPHNYCFPEEFSYSRGAKAKYADNVAAIKVMQTVEREHRNANPDEQAILARYSGWGGIADAFDESKDNWHSEYVELKSLLSNSEYEAARASILTAFYTEPYIINSIYKGLEHFGFKGGYILDPSMGTGNFFGNMPQEIAENSRLYGVELDSLTTRIARQLYPNANIQHKGFEQTRFSDKMFDVVVGNVPFGDFKPYDSNYDDEYYIHDYFFIKSLDKLKAGGIAALITSNGTLDKYNNKARLEMYRRADLIGAIRLPNNAFKTAGTEAVTDILFFQKSGVERDIDNVDEFPDWVTCDGVQINRLWFNCNTYFGNHTGNILGEMKRVSGPYGTAVTVEPYESGDIEERLDNAVMGLDARFYAEPTIEELPEIDEKEELPDGVRPFTYYVRDGKLYFAENDSTTEFTAKNKKTQQRIIDMCGIAEQVDTVIAIQRDGCSDEQLKQEQEVLNDLYDRFVKAHGNINDPINRRLFQDDIRAPKLSALEIECKNEHNEIFFRKADIFSKRTVNQHRAPDHADNAIEALHISLNLRQRVDIGYISKLCGKSEDEVIEELGENIYCNPAANNGDKYSGWETAEEYLSGHTKEKLGLAMVKAEENPDFARNVEALKKHQPIPVPITGIGFRLGSMFVPKEMFTQFMWDTFETSPLHKASVFEKDMISAEYISALNEWRIPNKTKEHSVKIDEMFGTSRINAYGLTELTLNQKRVEIKDITIDDNGNEKYVLNRKETILAREKQRKIETAFHDWVLSDSERIKRIEAIFNERYNSITPRKYDGSYIVVPGMAAGLDFMPHQKNAIARFAGGGCGLVAHEVGAGKTAFSAGLGMYLKSIGAINKPMYVVPNAVIGQFGEEFMRFFPEASVLVANDKDFEKQNRRRFLAKISAGNYDAVIISQSQFEKIPLSLERQEEMYDKKINELTLSIAEMKRENGERLSVKKLESQRKSLQKNIEKLRAEFKKDNFIAFEDLGCDYLIVDEAHNYKNLALFSKMHNVAGVNTSSNSQRAFDLECKTRYLQEINNGGGVILMTGTPISNAISEMFVWQYLLQYPRLKELGIEYFDNWASVFGNITQALEVKPSGSGFRMRTRFSQFVNLPELCNIFGEIADIVKTSELDIPLPQISGGKPEMIICEKSPTQEEQTEDGLARAKRIENKEVEPWEDNMLAICTYMTKVALDGRILEPNAEDFEGSKVNKCVEEILAIGKERPDTVQAVFCDTNTPTSDGFSVYKDIKEKLIASGQYNPDEVAFIHDAKNDKQKVEMFAKANEAKIRVIIGSTQKLGTGVNIQQRLIALHHLDAPFRPSDIEQRNGRGIRQGNTNPEVFVAYYATRGTFDTYRWQLLEKKQAVIAQIMSGRPAARTCEDIDEVALTFAEMKAAATDNPLIAEKLTVDNEVARLTLLKNDYISRQTALAENVKEKYPQQIATLERRLKNVFEDIKTVADNPLDDTFHMEMGGKKFYERSVAATEIEAHVKKYMYGEEFRAHEPIFVGNFHGFEFGLKHTGGNELSILLKGKNTYSSNYAFSGSGALTRLDNLFSKIQEQPDDIQSQIDFQNKQLQNAKEMLGVPFEYEAELTELLEKQSHLNMQLEFGEAPVEEIVDEENDEGESPEM